MLNFIFQNRAIPVLVKTGLFAGTRLFTGIFEKSQNMGESTSWKQSFDATYIVIGQRIEIQQLFKKVSFFKKSWSQKNWREGVFRVA